MSSNHKAISVPIVLEKHPNADRLSIIRLWDTVTYVANTEEWKDVKVGVFIPPDNLFDSRRPEFAEHTPKGKEPGIHRVKSAKIRGILSLGIMVKMPDDTPIDADFTEQLGIMPYICETDVSTRGHIVNPPGFYEKYDVENYFKTAKLFNKDEKIVITEKIHGSNQRNTYVNNTIYVGGRTVFHQEDSKLLFWKAFRQNPNLEEAIKKLPNYCLYGEAAGEQKNYKYGLKQGEFKFFCFDIKKPCGSWMDWFELEDTCNKYNIPMVPVIKYATELNLEECLSLAVGKSLIPGALHDREGCVVRPIINRWTPEIGRLQVKFVDPIFANKK